MLSMPQKNTPYHSGWTAAQLNTPVLAVDAIIQLESKLIVFVRRRNAPFQGWWALPGGACEIGETVEDTLRREVKEETGLDVEPVQLVGVFSDPSRDPRGHTVSVGFLARPVGGELRAGSDATQVRAFRQLPEQLAFDHRNILIAAKVL
jgi:8-oxo-dGTP diphosphatase